MQAPIVAFAEPTSIAAKGPSALKTDRTVSDANEPQLSDQNPNQGQKGVATTKTSFFGRILGWNQSTRTDSKYSDIQRNATASTDRLQFASTRT